MISRFVPIVVILSVALFTGCGGDTGTGPGSDENTDQAPSDGTPGVAFETLRGTYAGAFTSTSQGFDYAADVSVDFHQHLGNLSGSSTIAGTLTSGMQMSLAIRGASNFTGTIDPGVNPSVNITFVSECPGLSSLFTGTFDSEAQLLTISGPAHILADCEIVLTFPSMVLMERVVPLEDSGGGFLGAF